MLRLCLYVLALCINAAYGSENAPWKGPHNWHVQEEIALKAASVYGLSRYKAGSLLSVARLTGDALRKIDVCAHITSSELARGIYNRMQKMHTKAVGMDKLIHILEDHRRDFCVYYNMLADCLQKPSSTTHIHALTQTLGTFFRGLPYAYHMRQTLIDLAQAGDFDTAFFLMALLEDRHTSP